MESIRLLFNESKTIYPYSDASSVKMIILGCFFRSDVGCRTTFRTWVEAAEDGDFFSGNATGIEIEGNDVLLTDMYSEEEVPTVVRMTKEQFIKLFDEWLEKVCKTRPKELLIIYDEGEYRIEVVKE